MIRAPSARRIAREAGEVVYRTGTPCVRGHIGPRYVSNAYCLACAVHHAIPLPADTPVGVKRAAHSQARKAAALAGLAIYSTGKPCKRGHVAPRWTSGAGCTACRGVVNPSPVRTTPRAEAMAAGLAFYVTGRPCKRGHVSEHYTVDANCVECADMRQAFYASRGRQKPRAAVLECA